MVRSGGRPLLVLTLLGCPMITLAGEPKCDTLITAAPYTITAQGHYCLANDIAYAGASGAAITIAANSVVLDLRGYKIGGQAAGLGTLASGVRVANHGTVVIRNGLVRGFYIAVELQGGGANNNNLIEGIRADSNTRFGIYSIGGVNDTVRDCIVGSTGGTTTSLSYTVGIYLAGDQSFATDNTVTGTQPGSGGNMSYGIVVAGDQNRAVSNQVIGNGDTGTASNYCFGFNGVTLYKDNIASACGTLYAGGTPIGSTNYP